MKITKELKNITFEYDESSKTFTIINPQREVIELNKVYAFAFMRFVVRMAQRNWLRGKPTPEKTPSMKEEDPNNEVNPLNPDQTEFEYDLSNKMFNEILKEEAEKQLNNTNK
tara:strand:- start:2221 stop:2556 length:336 start_codon:yes stop_codon:yes gene_type:complete